MPRIRRENFCRPSGRCQQYRLLLQLIQRPHQGTDQRCFTRPRITTKHKNHLATGVTEGTPIKILQQFLAQELVGKENFP